MTKAHTAHDAITPAEQPTGLPCNSSPEAITDTEIGWDCRAWGSGSESSDWYEGGLFVLLTEVFGLKLYPNPDAQNETLATVSLEDLPAMFALITRIGVDPEHWPWLYEEDQDRDERVLLAARALGIPSATIAANAVLLEALQIA